MPSKLREQVRSTIERVRRRVLELARPRVLTGALMDLTRSPKDLMVENALLRHQVIVLKRGVKRPPLRTRDRLTLLVLATLSPTWSTALHVVQPATVLRWHRDAFRLVWRRKSRASSNVPRLDPEIIALIREMAAENRLWGAERIRGELAKLGIRVSKRTIQRYMRSVRRRPGGQTWATFIGNHRADIWACDFLQLYDLRFVPIFAFFVIELDRRKVVHVAITRAPTDEWVAQQLRNATPDGIGPQYLIRDRDSKFGAVFDRVAHATGIKVVETAVRTPDMNAYCERFLGSVRRECLDHIVILSERQLLGVLREYVAYFNEGRPHQGLGQGVPAGAANTGPARGEIVSRPVLGALHHVYRRAA